MSRHFASIAYTPGVRASQRLLGGRDLGERPNLMPGMEGDVARPELGPREREFIAARDSFYLSTVSETGWPHVQHRGGPAGFLQALGPNTLAFADLSGNRQYVSVGNLAANDRAALILIDYPNRRRLKILGHVEVLDMAAVDSKLAAKMKFLPAGTERLMLIRVAAFDWNCSQHITPRFTENEWQEHATTTLTKE